MSIYAQAEENQSQIASNSGWSEFGNWTDGLDVNRYGAIVALWEHGIWEDLATLNKQLRMAQQSEPPSEDVQKIIDEIIEFIEGEEFILITNGMSRAI